MNNTQLITLFLAGASAVIAFVLGASWQYRAVVDYYAELTASAAELEAQKVLVEAQKVLVEKTLAQARETLTSAKHLEMQTAMELAHARVSAGNVKAPGVVGTVLRGGTE